MKTASNGEAQDASCGIDWCTSCLAALLFALAFDMSVNINHRWRLRSSRIIVRVARRLVAGIPGTHREFFPMTNVHCSSRCHCCAATMRRYIRMCPARSLSRNYGDANGRCFLSRKCKLRLPSRRSHRHDWN